MILRLLLTIYMTLNATSPNALDTSSAMRDHAISTALYLPGLTTLTPSALKACAQFFHTGVHDLPEVLPIYWAQKIHPLLLKNQETGFIIHQHVRNFKSFEASIQKQFSIHGVQGLAILTFGMLVLLDDFLSASQDILAFHNTSEQYFTQQERDVVTSIARNTQGIFESPMIFENFCQRLAAHHTHTTKTHPTSRPTRPIPVLWSEMLFLLNCAHNIADNIDRAITLKILLTDSCATLSAYAFMLGIKSGSYLLPMRYFHSQFYQRAHITHLKSVDKPGQFPLLIQSLQPYPRVSTIATFWNHMFTVRSHAQYPAFPELAQRMLQSIPDDISLHEKAIVMMLFRDCISETLTIPLEKTALACLQALAPCAHLSASLVTLLTKKKHIPQCRFSLWKKQTHTISFYLKDSVNDYEYKGGSQDNAGQYSHTTTSATHLQDRIQALAHQSPNVNIRSRAKCLRVCTQHHYRVYPSYGSQVIIAFTQNDIIASVPRPHASLNLQQLTASLNLAMYLLDTQSPAHQKILSCISTLPAKIRPHFITRVSTALLLEQNQTQDNILHIIQSHYTYSRSMARAPL